MPVLAFVIAPQPVRYRAIESFQPDYYSNAERVQMLRVGWRMIREQPLFGVGPGRVDKLYTSYLAPGEPVPAYHGHLHNDAVHLAAQFGLPVLGASILFLAMLARDLLRAYQRASDRESRFLCSTALLGMAGFLLAGLTDYTYGHSLGLILFSFVSLAPLQEVQASTDRGFHHVEHLTMEAGEAEPCSPHASSGARDGSQPVAVIR
jgi:O-antigen ligase